MARVWNARRTLLGVTALESLSPGSPSSTSTARTSTWLRTNTTPPDGNDDLAAHGPKGLAARLAPLLDPGAGP